MSSFWQKLFGSKIQAADSQATKPVSIAAKDTAPLPPLPQEAETSFFTPGISVAQQTDLGQHRQNNQDALFTVTSYLETNQGTEPFGLFIVADGAGGHHGGELASALAIRIAAGHILENLYLVNLRPVSTADRPTAQSARPPLTEVLQGAVTKANDEILHQVPGSASTLTLAVMMGRGIYLAHVGDSRAYIYHQRTLQKITKDHSMVARLIEIGQITEEEAQEHPLRSTLYMALGQPNKIEAGTYIKSLPENGMLLLCSDGLWGGVPEVKIIDILASSSTSDEAVGRLIDAANDHGGDDNITAILVRFEEEA